MSETAVYALNTITYILLILYFPYIFLNVSFTTNFLVTADVPYYQNPSPIDTIWTDRYKVEWWFLAVGIFQIGVPALAAHAWLPDTTRGYTDRKKRFAAPGIYIISKVVIIATLTISVLLLIFRIIQLVPSILGCDDQMFCRNENPAKQAPNTANTLFIIHFIFLIVFILLDGIYLAYIYIWEKRSEFIFSTSLVTGFPVSEMFSNRNIQPPSLPHHQQQLPALLPPDQFPDAFRSPQPPTSNSPITNRTIPNYFLNYLHPKHISTTTTTNYPLLYPPHTPPLPPPPPPPPPHYNVNFHHFIMKTSSKKKNINSKFTIIDP